MSELENGPGRIFPTLQFEGGTVRVLLNSDAYDLSAIKKTSYVFSDRCTALVGPIQDGVLPLSLTFRATTPEAEALDTAHRFLRDLLDNQLREQIGAETRAMRSLILAHTFSRTNLIRRDS